MLLCGVLLNPIKFLAPCRRGLLFLITYFSIVFSYCLISVFVLFLQTELFLFFVGTFGYVRPWSWLQNWRLGVIAWFYCKLGKFSIQMLHFVSYYFILFLFYALLCFLTLGTMSSLGLGVRIEKMTKLKIFVPSTKNWFDLCPCCFFCFLN